MDTYNKKLNRTLRDIFAPWHFPCLLCGDERTDPNTGLCVSCFEKLPQINKPCAKCGHESPDSEICGDCQQYERLFIRAYMPFKYEGSVAHLIQQFKFNNKRYLMHPLGLFMADALPVEIKNEINAVIPVPLHKKRLRNRGYNQSELLARVVAEKLSLPLRCDMLCRIKYTDHQLQLTREQRLENVGGAFSSGDAAGMTILLIDDIFTSGATCGECVNTLLNAGAKGVYILTCAGG